MPEVPATTPLTCAFWNVNGGDRQELIAQLAYEVSADVVALAEYGDDGSLLDHLRRHVDPSYQEPPSEIRRLKLFSSRPDLDLREVYGDASRRLTVRALHFYGTEILLAVAHLVSRRSWHREDQDSEAQVLAQQLRDLEDRRGHRRTILCGDLNMNPFEDGLVKASGLHAMMTQTTVVTGSRQVQGQEYPFFYNPMWGFFGDRTPGPPGTYWYRHSGHLSYEWNLFDQVLVRAAILPWFRDVEIVTQIGNTKLHSADGRPDPSVGSDHFPITFRLRPATE
jgi:hypothetical protein